MAADKTATEESVASRAHSSPRPCRGLVLVWAGKSPELRPIAVGDGLTLGRDSADLLGYDDARMSRRHCAVRFVAGAWEIDDLGSRNGTFVDGVRVVAPVRVQQFRALRIGHCLLIPEADIRRCAGGVEVSPDGVVGPRMREVRQAIAATARASPTLLIVGTTGAGKELAARHFHRCGPRFAGPFVAVNCAAIPEGLAERVLFGTVRGAYSGAQSDALGYVQAADGGAFFLDEIGELDLVIQAKMLRFLETREAYAVGATHPRRVDLSICFATHRDLREMVRKGQFREDLYFRIGQPKVVVPPLVERPEEVPWLLARVFAEQGRGHEAHPQLVEACLLRDWPGNIRELMASLRSAIQRAGVDGVVKAEALDPDAGCSVAAPAPPPAPVIKERLDDAASVEAVLRGHHGNVTRAARALGVHRNQLRRWLAEHTIDPKSLGSASEPD